MQSAPDKRKRRFCYRYPHPAVTTDVMLVSADAQGLQVLLIKRARPPFRGRWALPGGFLDIDEDLEACARRELAEETGIRGVGLEQLYAYGRPGRDPRERVISIVFYGLVAADRLRPHAASDATAVSWLPLRRLPELAFDHAEIVRQGQQRVLAQLDDPANILQFLPERFTLTEAQRVYETLKQHPVDPRGFRRRMLARGCIEPTGELRQDGRHRPARLYCTRRL